MRRSSWVVVGGVVAVLGVAAVAGAPAAAGAAGAAGAQEEPTVTDGTTGDLGGDDVGDLGGDTTTIPVEEPSELVVDAGGPYNGVVGEPIALHGTVTGAQGDIEVIWSEDAEEIPCTFGDADQLDATITCHEPFQVGIVLSVEDLSTGAFGLDVALIHADEAPGGPTTAPPTSPTTVEPSPSPGPSSPPSLPKPSPSPSPSAGAGVDRLADTGAASGELAATGGALLAAGTAALVGARRRRRTHPAAP